MFSLQKSSTSNYTIWIGLLVLVVVLCVCTSSGSSRLGRRHSGSRKSVSLASRFSSWLSSGLSRLSSRLSRRFSRRKPKSRKHKTRRHHIRLSRSLGSSSVRVNSPNTAYFIHYHVPQLCHCTKHKHLNDPKITSVEVKHLVKKLTKQHKKQAAKQAAKQTVNLSKSTVSVSPVSPVSPVSQVSRPAIATPVMTVKQTVSPGPNKFSNIEPYTYGFDGYSKADNVGASLEYFGLN